MKKPTYLQRGLALLDNLYKREHYGCNNTTCSMDAAFRNGYSVHAIECFASTGAASKRFTQIFEALTKRHGKYIDRQSRSEANKLCKEVEHVECECGAVVWELSWNEGYCSNCGNNVKTGAK